MRRFDPTLMPWRQAEPYQVNHWRTVIEILVSVPIVAVLFLGIPFLLWLIADGGAQ